VNAFVRSVAAALAAVLAVGCATKAGSNEIHWDIVQAHPAGGSVPEVKSGQMFLSGRAVRSANLYSAPLTIACELQAEGPSTNCAFYVDLVPAGRPLGQLPNDYLAVKLVHRQELRVWVFRGNEPRQLIEPTPIQPGTDGRYKLTIEAQRDRLVVHVNNGTVEIGEGVAYAKFRVELRSFPPASDWRVSDLVIR
jgi:hypothetical protein